MRSALTAVTAIGFKVPEGQGHVTLCLVFISSDVVNVNWQEGDEAGAPRSLAGTVYVSSPAL